MKTFLSPTQTQAVHSHGEMSR